MKSNNNVKNVHFVGIGGVSMSSLAVWTVLQGYHVTGSDLTNSDTINELQKFGIKIFFKHEKQNINHADLVVYSNATDNSCEVITAQMLGIKTISRAEYLANMLKEYKNKICVSGAHGKTTTTALIYNILKQATKNPSLHLGGSLCESGKNYVYYNKEYMVCEACEYKDAFLKLPASIGVILNIAPEHLDYFKDYQGVISSFAKFAKNSQNLVINYDFYNKSAVFFKNIEKKDKKVITFGLSNGNFSAANIKQNSNGTYTFDCLKNGEHYAHINLNLIGKHNILNALAAISVCDYYNIAKEHICAGLQNFNGVQRRYEYLHKTKFLVHDYAHHPDEILAILEETQKFYKDKLLVVFQPHTYSRTKTLINEFTECFKSVSEIVLLKTYSAREKYDYKGSACYLAKVIGNNAIYIPSKTKAQEYILQKIKKGYGVLFLGAGDIYTLSKIVAKLC